MDQQTMGTILPGLMNLDTLVYFVIVVAGTICHFLKKCMADKIELGQYWTTRKYTSILSIFGAVVGFAMLLAQHDTSIFSFFCCGYLSDSLFNRADAKV